MSEPLIPVDRDRCQAEKGGAFMFGPGRRRCESAAAFIATENEPGPDGQRGAMSLCRACAGVFESRNPGVATLEEIDDLHPLYTHDCKGCTFLGTFKSCDLYHCQQGQGGKDDTLIARHGGGPGDYFSGLVFRDRNKYIAEAFRRATERGLIGQESLDAEDAEDAEGH